MSRLVILRSVTFRLVAGLVIGGLIVSFGLGVLELRRSESVLQMRITQRVALTTRNTQNMLRALLEQQSAADMRQALASFLSEEHIRGIRVTAMPHPPIELGRWDDEDARTWAVWSMPQNGIAVGNEVDMAVLTHLRAPFSHQGALVTLELLVDGPEAHVAMRKQVLRDLGAHWLFLAVMLLIGLLLLRRWVTEPLGEVVQLVGEHAGPEPFYRLARQSHGEFGKLAEAVGGMLTRLQNTTEQLRKRERAFENLYQFAPAAMVSLDSGGRIVEANRRAAELLRVSHERDLIKRAALEFVLSEDRALLRQTIDRLALDNNARCELRLMCGDRPLDVAVECTGVRDEDGGLQAVRLSLLDVSESKQLQRELADKSRLLNLLIDHMSDGILLVDAQGQIVAYNQQLATLLRVRPEGLYGQSYDVEHFWDELGVLNHDLFIDRMRQIDADLQRPAQERFEARAGTFLFQGIPVHDGTGEIIGRLWVLQEITSQEQNQRLLAQQTSQLQALKRLGLELAEISGIDDLLQKASQQLFEIFGVEAVGLALRHDGANGARSRQMLHRGPGPYLLEPNAAMIKVVERHLMPQILSNSEVTFWADLPRDAWARTFNQAGLTCLAGGPLNGSADAQGILWIARRGGERLERHHIYLLEALGPVIAARLEIAQLFERMHGLELTDITTDLPNRQSFEHEVRALVNRPGHVWSLVMLKLDHFRSLNDLVDHEAADRLLRKVGMELRRVTRKSCFVGRLRGPTFGVLVPHMDRQDVISMAERLRQTVAEIPVELPDAGKWRLTASVGVVCSPHDGLDGDDLLDLARVRVEAAKRSGRDRVVAEGPDADRSVG
jgi:diguanylate cyclase (GGDEF)-like protein/PAS domain S-box-containing protein